MANEGANESVQGTGAEAARHTTVDPLRTTPYESSVVRTEPLNKFAPGTQLNNRYVLQRVLGRGGMGQVYLGRDAVLDRSVAIKVIRPRDPHLRDRSLYEADFREAFTAEARIGANLTHPAIATVYDFGFQEGEPFIVFEYIAGETLHEVIRRRGRLPLQDVRLILGPLAQALDFAHSRHLVHRDLKPENIRATAQGYFKVLDLGLAREFRQQIDWSFAGTPAYASPEQAANLPCDGRTDQYALALIAYEMLTGHRLFESDDWRDILRMHREQEPPSPRRFVPDLPESVCTALLRALQKDPNLRFARCEEFAVAFGCQLLNAPVPLPEILRLTAVSRMRGEWNSARFRLIRKGTAVYLVLSRDALWAAYRGEIRCWPLQAMTEVRSNRWGNILHLRFSRANEVIQQSFRFAHRKEGWQWLELLQNLQRHLPDATAEAAEWPSVEPVVLMQRPPAMRYQALGPVDYQDAKPRRAEVGLQVRAAMMGADAVVDVQQERLPQLGQTVQRRSGTAIKAVDTAGRRELRSRWFSTQVAQLSRWMLILIGVSFVGTMLASWLVSLLSVGGIGMPLSPHETMFQRLGSVTLFVVLIHSWPFALALLTRWSLWPQTLRPAALAIVALGTKPLFSPLGWLAAGVTHGRWAGGAVFFLTLVDPINLSILLFACFLCQRAWRSYGEYRKLAPDAEQGIPSARRVVGSLTLAASGIYLVLLGGFMVWGQYSYARGFAFPGNEAWKENEGHKHLTSGLAQMSRNPQAAEAEFRRALLVWQELMDANPSWPEQRHNVAAVYQNLGVVLTQQRKYAEGEKAYRQALSHYEMLDADFPTYRNHRKDHEAALKNLRQLLVLKPFLDDHDEMEEARRLDEAGQYGAVLRLFRQALQRHEQKQPEIPNKADYQRLLAFKQNRLAWFLVICADVKVRDPKQAVELATKAVANAPEDWAIWNTLGAAYLRAGKWQESITALEKSVQMRKGGDGMDWLFLAMAYHYLGKTDQAKKWLDQALDWQAQMEQGNFANPLAQMQWQEQRREVEIIRREAEELIRPKRGKSR